MIKNSLQLLVFICSTIFADCLLYESEEYANEGVIAYRKQCEEYGGGGGKFSFSVSQSSSENTCAGGFVEGAYILRVSCNTCGSLEIVEELEKNKKFCNEKCKTPKMICLTQYEAWGSSLSGTVESCGMDDFSISGCEESSSSEEQSSSSMESSSSDTRSSSSANGSSDSGTTLSSTESGSSSGVVCEDGPCSGSSSSGAGATLEHCYQGAPGSCMFIGDYFFEIPRMLQPIVLPSNQTGRCWEGKYAVQTNIPILIGYEYYCAEDAGCSGPLHKKIAYSCVAAEGERTVEQGCMYDDGVPLYGRDGSSFAVVMLGKKGLIEVSSVWSASRHPTPAIFDTTELLNAVRLTYGDPEYLADSCAKLFSPQSSSQGCEEDPDSPYPCEESSSSSDIESSSSSETESSSSEEESSSSAGCFVSGVDQVYSPEQVFNDCLENMEPGKCYSLNPDRGVQTGWISSNAQDSWWWREVDCGTGERVDSSKVGVCPGFPLDRVPSNPESACFAYNGSCYKCNADRGSECANSWLWQGSFTPANIGWWYEEVDCDDPFEDDFDGQCPDGNALMKRTINYGSVENVDDYGYGFGFRSRVNYDLLGRKISKRNNAKLALYRRNSDKFYKKSTDRLQRTIEKIFEGINHRNSRRALFKRDDCGHLRGDYGIIENGQKVGGITCPDAGPLFSTPNVLDNKFLEETCIVKDCEYKKVWVRVGTTLQMSLTSIDYYVVDVGFVFPDGYVTTQKDHNAVEKHEKGHVEDFKCIVKKFPEETKYIEVEVEACNEKDALNAAITESVQPYLDEMKKEYDKRFKRATDRYHQKYDSFKYPEDNYVCPSDL
ncbi:hypothetical protein [Fibrobacter sp.]|uniref:hypothetical protein n=1 Tax=Fibrobacter sp. TaxID=35828 RepID=UPI002623C3E5|nr:hypothetical protein [Fibrobacter sp.]MDD5942726.1 hypothetical protein [Fibrobacter sp.]